MNNYRIPSIEMGVSNTGTQRRCKALWVVTTIICAVALHPARVNAEGGSAPTDPQIVGIVETADDSDINYANLALSKAKDKQVRDVAQQMITDHSAVQKSVINLATKLNVSPADSPTSDSLKKQAEQTTSETAEHQGQGVRESIH
jgi:putative membrane protein